MKRYIDFFKKNKIILDSTCHPLLNFFREKAFEHFQQIGFSPFHSEEYRHTDIVTLLKNKIVLLKRLDWFKNLMMNPHHEVIHHNVFYKINYLQHFTVNGYYCELEKTKKRMPYGVFWGSLNTFALQYPDLFLKYYYKQAKTAKDILAILNTMFLQDGYVLYISKNIALKKPIQLTNILYGRKDLLINRRILIILEENAQTKILICNHTVDKYPAFAFTQIIETYLGENAVLDFCEIEESSEKTIRLTEHFASQKIFSTFTLHSISLNNGITRNNYKFSLDGEQAKIILSGIIVVTNRQKIDNFTIIRHNAPKCQSNETFKYLLSGESTGSFIGKIIVNKQASQTEAYQKNQNILNGNRCRMYSEPQLEIDTNDVKCSHGMSMGQLDESALFYMRSRGISKNEARFLLKLAFVTDVLKEIKMEELKDRLRLLIEKRFKEELIDKVV